MGISLDAVSRMIRSLWPHKAHGMAEASRILGQLDDMLAPVSPLSRQGMFSDLQVVLRCFGDVAIRRVMEYRLDTLAGYGGVTPSLTETVHMAELMHDVHDEEAALVQAFRAWGIEIATPYLDSAYVCAVLKLDPRVRYCIDKQTKWLPQADTRAAPWESLRAPQALGRIQTTSYSTGCVTAYYATWCRIWSARPG